MILYWYCILSYTYCIFQCKGISIFLFQFETKKLYIKKQKKTGQPPAQLAVRPNRQFKWWLAYRHPRRLTATACHQPPYEVAAYGNGGSLLPPFQTATMVKFWKKFKRVYFCKIEKIYKKFQFLDLWWAIWAVAESWIWAKDEKTRWPSLRRPENEWAHMCRDTDILIYTRRKLRDR